jgi:predicted CoA-binding protein
MSAVTAPARDADGRIDHDAYTNNYLLGILNDVRTIAMLGASASWNRPSFFAMKYLQQKGYRVIPVNPRYAGGEILGETVYAALGEIPVHVDMVDVFRSSDAVPGIVEEILALPAERRPQVLWLQLGVRDDAAARQAEDAGMQVVMDRCPKIEFGRLNAELSWGGFNSGVISSKRRRVSLS